MRLSCLRLVAMSLVLGLVVVSGPALTQPPAEARPDRAAAESAERMAHVFKPQAVVLEVRGQKVKLEPHTELCAVLVVAGGPMPAVLCRAGGPEAEALVETDVGTVYAVRRDQLLPADELRKAALAGKLPPVYPAYRYAEADVFPGGAVLVRLAAGGRREDLAAVAGAHGLVARDAKDGATLLAPAAPRAPVDPFAAATAVAQVRTVAWAEPVLVIRVPPPAKDQGKEQGKDRSKDRPDEQSK